MKVLFDFDFSRKIAYSINKVSCKFILTKSNIRYLYLGTYLHKIDIVYFDTKPNH